MAGTLEQSHDDAHQRQSAALVEAEKLIDRLHRQAEEHREALVRAIHDDLGGLLVAAAMDLIQVQKRSSDLRLVNLGPLSRGTQSLQSAIEVGRRLVEQLRPSMLDNFGLFAALKWHLRQASKGSSAQLTESFPADEPGFDGEAVTTLFRVAEEAINLIFRRDGVMAAGVILELKEGSMTMKFSGDGVPELVNGVESGLARALTSMQHRIRSLGGTIILVQADNGTVLEALVPLQVYQTPAP